MSKSIDLSQATLADSTSLVEAVRKTADGNTTVEARIACQPAGSNVLYFDTRDKDGRLVIGNVAYDPSK